MFDKVIKKLNINKTSMLKHGTVAIITMFGVWILFGVKNIMIAFPIALTSTVLSRQNFHVKTVSKIMRITILELIIVCISFISSQSLYLSIPINLLSIFFIMYSIVSPYDLSVYKPFLMLYVFTQYSAISLEELPNRLLSVIFGVCIVIIGSQIDKINEKNILGKSIETSLLLIKKQLESILMEEFQENLVNDCSKIMRGLAYRVYITRHRKYLTTNLGRHQFKIYISIEYLNISLIKIFKNFKNGLLSREHIEDIYLIIDYILLYIKSDINIKDVLEYTYDVAEKYTDKKSYGYIIMENLLLLVENIEVIDSMNKKEINKIYKEWERSNIDKRRTTFIEYFNIRSIRFRFAARMSITLTIALFLGEYLGYYKVIWMIITIMSIMQPYYEDTLSKTKDRILGNVIAIIFTGVLINLVNARSVTLIVLICSLYLLYAYREYDKISLFAGISSICISSLSENINILLFYRVVYVILGVLVILLVNNYLFPYSLNDGIEDLKRKIIRLNNLLVSDSIKQESTKKESRDIRDIIIHITLLCEKLYLRNLRYKSEEVDNFIKVNNEMVIEIGYKVLFSMGQ